MSHIKFDYSKVLDKFVAPHELDYMQPQVTAADSAPGPVPFRRAESAAVT